jgi:hypothetical protein
MECSNGYNGTPNGNGHAPKDGGQGASFDIALSAHDRALVRRALKERWPVSDTMKRRLLAQVGKALRKELEPRALGQLGRIIITAEGQNQADEHLADKNARIDGGQATEGLDIRVIYKDRAPLEGRIIQGD